MEIRAEVREVVRAECTLGEGPCWDAGRQLLWFTDIKRHRLWCHDPATGEATMAEAPGQIGWALPAEDGRLLCGLKDGLHFFEPSERSFARLGPIPGEPPGNRSNDACTDQQGRVWMGTMDDGESAPTGRYYRFERGAVTPAGPADIPITNGPAISPDGATIYFTHTLGQKIFCAFLRDDGAVGEVRLFADTAQDLPDAHPDGPVVDSEGHVWSAFYGGGYILRYAPDGRLAGRVVMPTSNITKLAFGGADLRTAYVTTARGGLSEEQVAEQPLAGSLLAFEAPVAGFAQKLVKLA